MAFLLPPDKSASLLVPSTYFSGEQHSPFSASLTQQTNSFCLASSPRHPRRFTVIPSSSFLACISSGLMDSSFCVLYNSSFSVYKASNTNMQSGNEKYSLSCKGKKSPLWSHTSNTRGIYLPSYERLHTSTLFEHLVLSQISILGQGTVLDRLG